MFSDCIYDYITLPLKFGETLHTFSQLHGQVFLLDTVLVTNLKTVLSRVVFLTGRAKQIFCSRCF